MIDPKGPSVKRVRESDEAETLLREAAATVSDDAALMAPAADPPAKS